MTPIALDIETEPRADVRELLPPELISDEVPHFLLNPEKPESWGEPPAYGKPKVMGEPPAYGKDKEVPELPEELANISDDGEREMAIEKWNEECPELIHNAKRQAKIADWKVEKQNEVDADAEQRATKQQHWIQAKEDAWEKKRQKGIDEWKEKLEEAREDFVEKAALDARLGFVRMIGWRTVKDGKPFYVYGVFDEEGEGKFGNRGAHVEVNVFAEEGGLLEWFLSEVYEWIKAEWEADAEYHRILTYYGNKFDFPFIIRRAWVCGIRANPTHFMEDFEVGKHRFFRQSFIDLDDAWKMSDTGMKTGGLGELARLLGCGEKNDDGARFFEIYREEPKAALDYLENDLNMTWEVAEVMQLTGE